MSSWTERALVALVFALTLSDGASAQSVFGRNKVVYANREWWVLEDGWLHLYYYPEEEELARQTLAIAREAYAKRSRRAAGGCFCPGGSACP